MGSIRVGDVVGEDIRIDAEVGRGSFGIVYRGLQVRLARKVAVKVLNLSELPDAAEAWRLFEREAMVLARLKHPQIVEIYTMGIHKRVPYIVMEWLQGETLQKKLLREGYFSEQRALQLVEQIAKPLAKAHERSLIHRDLKPENIFELHDGTIKLIDFGLGRPFGISERGRGGGDVTAATTTIAGMVRGTPRFMSPEQAAGGEVDHRTDIYSLGVVLYSLLTQKTPFGNRQFNSEESLIEHIASGVAVPTDITVYRSDLSTEMQALIRTATAFSPTDRFQSAVELERAVRNILASRADPALTPDRAGVRLMKNVAENWRQIHRGPQCQVWARREGAAVETLSVGYLDEAAGRMTTEVFDAAIKEVGHCIAFHDWWDVSGYETPMRNWWARWLAAQKPGTIHGVYMLTRSIIVRMGLSVANIKYPHITFQALKDRDAYDLLRRSHMSPRTSDPRR